MLRKMDVIRCMYDLGSRFRSFEVECALVCETNNKNANLPFSDKNWTVIRKRNFEALRGRFWKKSKLKSFRKLKILGSNADRFWKLSSKGFQIWENPRLVVPDLIHGQNHFNKSFEQFKSRIWFWWKKESCRKLRDLQLSWRKHF